MTQTIEAVYSEGVLKPLQELALPDHQRVRLTVEPIDGTEQDRSEAMEALLKRLRESSFSHGGPYPTREELHER